MTLLFHFWSKIKLSFCHKIIFIDFLLNFVFYVWSDCLSIRNSLTENPLPCIKFYRLRIVDFHLFKRLSFNLLSWRNFLLAQTLISIVLPSDLIDCLLGIKTFFNILLFHRIALGICFKAELQRTVFNFFFGFLIFMKIYIGGKVINTSGSVSFKIVILRHLSICKH